VGVTGTALKDDMQTVQDREILDRERFILEGMLEETAKERAELTSHVLQGDDGAVELLSLVDEAAADLGVVLSTRKLEVIQEKDERFNTLEISFKTVGEESRVQKMLQLFESLPYRSQVIDLQVIRSTDKETGQPLMDSTAVLHVSLISE